MIRLKAGHNYRNPKKAVAVALSVAVHGVVGVAVWGNAPRLNPPQALYEGPVIALDLRKDFPIIGESGGAEEQPTQGAVAEEEAPQDQAKSARGAVIPPIPVRAAKPAPAVETITLSGEATGSDLRVLGLAEMSSARQLGGRAGTGGSGAGGAAGGVCDMAGRLEAALKEDARVLMQMREAQARLNAGERPILIWDGDWVQSSGQAGRGLAGVRQAIAVEIAFAPKACRDQAMQGLIILSVSDAQGAPRIALGTSHWQWSRLTQR